MLVVGNDEHTAEMAIQMLRFTPHVTIVTNTGALGMTPAVVERLDQHRVRLVVGRIASAHARKRGMLATVRLEGDEEFEADHLFSAQGAEPECALARALGVRLSGGGYVEVDTEGKTSVPGVFAAGDVTRLFSHQIVTAGHEGATAANTANYYLFDKDEEAVHAARGEATS